MGDERLRAEIREEQGRIISALRSAGDHWEMAKAEDSFANLLERMADELEMASAHDRGRFLAAARRSGIRRRSTSTGPDASAPMIAELTRTVPMLGLPTTRRSG